MNNRPYISQTSNVYNENLYNTIPAQYGNTNVFVTQGQHRKVIDGISTSIVGQPTYQPQQQMNDCMRNQQNSQQPGQLCGQRQIIPNGITYTFNSVPQNYNPTNYTNCSAQLNGIDQNMGYQPHIYIVDSFERQIALNKLEQNALESILIHEQFQKNPFRLQFHKNELTDTNGLPFKCPEPCCCMTKETLLNSMETAEPNANSCPPNPEQIYPESRKQLRIKEKEPNFEDKGIQNTPTQESREIQYNSTEDCKCTEQKEQLAADQSQSKMIDNQTETKKVTFDEDNDKSTKKNSPKSRRRRTQKKRSRNVDEDSSDSSNDTSQSSDDSN